MSIETKDVVRRRAVNMSVPTVTKAGELNPHLRCIFVFIPAKNLSFVSTVERDTNKRASLKCT